MAGGRSGFLIVYGSIAELLGCQIRQNGCQPAKCLPLIIGSGPLGLSWSDLIRTSLACWTWIDQRLIKWLVLWSVPDGHSWIKQSQALLHSGPAAGKQVLGNDFWVCGSTDLWKLAIGLP